MFDLPRDIGTGERSSPPFEPMLKHFYELRGWDEAGNPRPETLDRLGLPRTLIRRSDGERIDFQR